MHRRVTVGLAALRTTGVGALLLLIWNPAALRLGVGGAPRLVLLDGSLSMAGRGGHWAAALDTARALAHGDVIWRFGARVTAFDTLAPRDGASRLAPALAAAAARGGPVAIVTDGAIADRADAPADLLRSARIVVLPRTPFFDAFVSNIDGPGRVGAGDTIRLKVSYGTVGKRERGNGKRTATLVASVGGRRLASRVVDLPDSGVVSADLTFPASRFSFPGWVAVEVGLEGVGDEEARDDARTLVLQVSAAPSIVLLASPPDWDTRFLAHALEDVAQAPVKVLVAADPGGTRWRDAATLTAVRPGEVARAVRGAALLVEAGDPATFARVTAKGALLVWPLGRRQEGDWYVQPPVASPIAGALAGVAWDSLPPVTALGELAPSSPSDSSPVIALTARLARRGPPRAVIALSQRDGKRRATIAAGGLYRWAFRGGASAEAYRALVAGLTDWLLAGGTGSGERFVPVTTVTANGLPLQWRWTAAGEPRDVVLSLATVRGQQQDTLRFDAGGRAELWLPPGQYRYAAAEGPERGLVAVDTYSDEWRPAPVVVAPQPGATGGRLAGVALRDRWWLFVAAIAAFAGEWAWRRRQGLP
ncbi:MAG: hypothetical protein AUH22_00465 [Gemmatimonadetes bacterium 13_2_20CM_1_70_33]|nr:MAG: hypothetical protein AUH22_00465 [Gemmatimonadetes bacterium 13_2_20CM_1_70_33]